MRFFFAYSHWYKREANIIDENLLQEVDRMNNIHDLKNEEFGAYIRELRGKEV